ncbi:hypothetical protein [Streptomyces violascens]|uniref:hypothetical protein n=1 Tax=Streptomyces violascens TaxID=67381 RepID=UPI001CFE0714|nr:hypothetical protein [Streptomyces violascens]
MGGAERSERMRYIKRYFELRRAVHRAESSGGPRALPPLNAYDRPTTPYTE